MGWRLCWCVSLPDAEWEPSLLALWIKSSSNVQVSIDLGQKLDSNTIIRSDKFLQENNFKAAIPSIELVEIGGTSFTAKFNVLISKSLSF